MYLSPLGETWGICKSLRMDKRQLAVSRLGTKQPRPSNPRKKITYNTYGHHLLPNSQIETTEPTGYLLQCSWSDDQPINHVDGDADDRRGSYAITQHCGPVGVIIIKKP